MEEDVETKGTFDPLQPASPGMPPANPYRIGSHDEAAAVIHDSSLHGMPAAAHCVNHAGDLMEVCFPAEAGQNFRLEASSDLRNWETLHEAAASDGMWHFIDVEMPDHPQRFYRLTPEPVAEPVE